MTNHTEVIRTCTHPVIRWKQVYEVYNHKTHIVTFHRLSTNMPPFDGVRLHSDETFVDYLKATEDKVWWGEIIRHR